MANLVYTVDEKRRRENIYSGDARALAIREVGYSIAQRGEDSSSHCSDHRGPPGYGWEMVKKIYEERSPRAPGPTRWKAIWGPAQAGFCSGSQDSSIDQRSDTGSADSQIGPVDPTGRAGGHSTRMWYSHPDLDGRRLPQAVGIHPAKAL